MNEDRYSSVSNNVETMGSVSDNHPIPDNLSEGLVISDRFRLIKKLGKGGFGAVWKAYDLQDELEYALKFVLHKRPDSEEDVYKANLDLVKNAYKKIRKLRHPNICIPRFSGEDPKHGYYFIVDFLEGQSLDGMIQDYQKTGRKIPYELSMSILEDLASALDYIHGERVIHRDVKPQNIMVSIDSSKRPQTQLIDFGLAATLHNKDSMIVSQQHFGWSPWYAAPEQWERELPDRRSEQFSLGLVAYELFSGGILPRPRYNPPEIEGVPGRVNKALKKVLSYLQKDRFENCTQFVQALREETITVATGSSSKEPKTPAPLPEGYLNSQGQRFKLIPAGEFMMGDTLTPEEVVKKYPGMKEEWCKGAHPRHKVNISQPFYMGIHEVTVREFRNFVESTGYQTTAEKEGTAWGHNDATNEWEYVKGLNWRNPGFAQESNHPVTCVSWNDAQAYIEWLNTQAEPDRPMGYQYGLPSEAQWEYACRERSTTDFYWGNDASQGEGYINGPGEEEVPWGGTWTNHFPFKTGYKATSPVGHYKPNAWGLYDMLGNVWEWCQDWYGDYPSGTVTDPTGPANGSCRVCRGGGWRSNPGRCRCAYRYSGGPEDRDVGIGFRLLLSSQR